MPSLPDLPDVPGKGLLTGTTRRARVAAAGAGLGAIAVGGFLVRRVLGRGKVDADPIAETPTSPPNAEAKEPPVKPKPKPPKAKPAPAEKPKPASKPAARPKAAAKPKAKAAGKPPKPKPAPKAKPAAPAGKVEPPQPGPDEETLPVPSPEPPAPTGTDAPSNPAKEPGNHSADKDPHHALNNPVGDPDETEFPDPYEKRSDPRDPVDPDGEPFGEEPHPQVGSESTSEPPPELDPTLEHDGKPPQRDKLDE